MPSSTPNSPYFNCCYQNVRGLNSKIDKFYSSISECEFEVVALTETWIQQDVLNSELFPDNYTVYRSDRNLQLTNYHTGGGTLLACKNNIKSEILNLSIFDESCPATDIVGCKLLVNFVLYLYLLFIYRLQL